LSQQRKYKYEEVMGGIGLFGKNEIAISSKLHGIPAMDITGDQMAWIFYSHFC
jgi:hypothetical protein